MLLITVSCAVADRGLSVVPFRNHHQTYFFGEAALRLVFALPLPLTRQQIWPAKIDCADRGRPLYPSPPSVSATDRAHKGIGLSHCTVSCRVHTVHKLTLQSKRRKFLLDWRALLRYKSTVAFYMKSVDFAESIIFLAINMVNNFYQACCQTRALIE